MDKKFGVAVKAIVSFKGKFLIVFKSDSEDVNPNSYDIPGGRLEFGEQPIDALIREVKEETGLTVRAIRPTRTWSFVKDDDFQLIGITFFCEADSNNIKLSNEHTNDLWLSAEEINERTDFPSWIKEEINAAVQK
jgi:8-oxo-dGTP diphosphatase